MLVNNAGIAVSGPMHGSDVDRLEAMVDINVTAALRKPRDCLAETKAPFLNLASGHAIVAGRM